MRVSTIIYFIYAAFAAWYLHEEQFASACWVAWAAFMNYKYFDAVHDIMHILQSIEGLKRKLMEVRDAARSK